MQNVFRGVKQDFLFSSRVIFLFTLLGFGDLVVAHAGTPANTLIQNFATVDFVSSGVPQSTVSNTSSFRVDELIAFTLTSNNPSGVTVQSPQTNAVLSYTLTNEGNGTEDFQASITQSLSDDFDPTSSQIYLDANSNSTYEDGVDVQYTPTVNDPVLAAGGSLTLFIVSSIQAALSGNTSAELNLNVTSKTGAGPAGTPYNGLGEGGVDALMGLQGGTLSVAAEYIVNAATITKSVSVLDPNGGTAPIQNAILTYTLSFNVAGTGNITSVVIGDVIPAGTTYVANSLRLNALPLTDAADADAGVFNGTAVQVSLGTVAAPTTRTVTFQVRIQ